MVKRTFNWTLNSEAMNWSIEPITIVYVVKPRGAEYPTILKFIGHGFEDDMVQINSYEEMVDIIRLFTKQYGLSQATLWDTYYLAKNEVSISRTRRNDT